MLIDRWFTCGISLSCLTAKDLGLLTLENPNLWKLFGSEPRLSVSERECSESEKPGGGARARGRFSGPEAGAGAGHTVGREAGWADGGGGGTPPYISTSFRPCYNIPTVRLALHWWQVNSEY